MVDESETWCAGEHANSNGQEHTGNNHRGENDKAQRLGLYDFCALKAETC